MTLAESLLSPGMGSLARTVYRCQLHPAFRKISPELRSFMETVDAGCHGAEPPPRNPPQKNIYISFVSVHWWGVPVLGGGNPGAWGGKTGRAENEPKRPRREAVRRRLCTLMRVAGGRRDAVRVPRGLRGGRLGRRPERRRRVGHRGGRGGGSIGAGAVAVLGGECRLLVNGYALLYQFRGERPGGDSSVASVGRPGRAESEPKGRRLEAGPEKMREPKEGFREAGGEVAREPKTGIQAGQVVGSAPPSRGRINNSDN